MPLPRRRRLAALTSPKSRAAAAACAAALVAAVTTLPQAQAAERPAASATAPRPGLDATALANSLEAVHDAGMYGIYSAVHDGEATWAGAAGVADRDSGRPARPFMRQRIGSITKSLTAVALLQQVEAGRLDLDAPISRYLPGLVPGARGEAITVRMLLNHTSGLGDYVVYAFPSLLKKSTRSLDDDRFRHITPQELVRYGVQAPPTGAPGQRWSYSNTNYVIAGLLLGKLTGGDPEAYITRNVIGRAGLKDTYFPRGPRITGPHAGMYESFYGLIDPPRDYSVYDMSWAWTAGAAVSTMDDLNRFYHALLTGGLLRPAELRQMLTTVPVKDAAGRLMMSYGLGIYRLDLPCGGFWGHDGAVWGAGTLALSSRDGARQMALGYNLMKYQKIAADGTLEPNPIDKALSHYAVRALCGPAQSTGGAEETLAAPGRAAQNLM